MTTGAKIAADNKAFLRAKSHSRRVWWTKRLLPLAAVSAVVVMIGAVFLHRVLPDVALNLPNATVQDGKLVMANPKMDGFTSDKRRYNVTAQRATQDLRGKSALELDQLRADVELDDGRDALLVSPTGIFDNAANRLTLPEQAVLTTTDGMRAEFGRADINVQTGAVDASQNVKITSKDTTIIAETMRLKSGGKHIVFENNVQVVMQPTAELSGTTGDSKPVQ